MDTSVERLEGNLVKLTVKLSAEEVGKAVEDAYRSTSGKVNIPGFRKGKAPKAMVDRYVGRERVLAEAQEELLSSSYPKALDAEDLRPIDAPDTGDLDLVEEGKPYEYSATVAVRPQYELSSITDLTVEVPPAKAADADVEAQIDHLRDRFATLEPVEDRGIEDGDFVLLSFIGKVGGEDYEGNSVDKYLYELGRGQMPKDFDAALLGHKAGERFQVEFEVPDTSTNPDFVGKTASFDVTAHEVKRKALPEVDDEFAGNVGGFDTADELRADIRSKLDDSKSLANIRETETRSRQLIASRLQGEVPETMVHQRRDAMLRDFFRGLDARGISLEDYIRATGVGPEQIQKDVEDQAGAVLAEELALEALFRQAGLELSEDDIEAEFIEIAGQSEKTVEQVRKDWEEAGLLAAVREQAVHRKATRWLMDNVEAVEREPVAESDEAEEPAKPKAKAKPRKKKTEEEGS